MFVHARTTTTRAIDNFGEASNIASVTFIVQDCDLMDIFQVPSTFPFISTAFYNYVHVSKDGPTLVGGTPAHIVQWEDTGLLQFSLLFEGRPYYKDLRDCMPNPSLLNASFTLSGCGIDGLDGDYWVTRREGNEIWVEKNNGWAVVFTNDANYIPEFCGYSEVSGSHHVQTESTGSNQIDSSANKPMDQPHNVRFRMEMHATFLNDFSKTYARQ